MNIHYLQHVPFEGLGSIEVWAQSRRDRVTATRLYGSDALPRLADVDLLIVMGGPMNIYEHDRYPWLLEEKRFIERAITAGKPVLGVCLGAQLVADVLGARVYRNAEKEIGWFPIETTAAAAATRAFRDLPRKIEAFHWHGDTFDIPRGAVHLARSAACENQAFTYDERVVGLQFHLETTPQSARAIIEHSADEIVPGRFIQSAEAMLSDAHRFVAINEAMRRVLDGLAAIDANGDARAGERET